jgi:replicative DNA helicase
LVSVKAGLRELFATMGERYEHPRGLLGLPTPWVEFNAWTRGLQRKRLYVVAARPSMGKSVFGGQLAVLNGLRGANVAWFSVEMTSAECMERAVSAIADVDYTWVQEPNKDDPDSDLHWAAVSRAMERLVKASMLIDDTPALSRAQFMARARRAHMQRKLDLIVVDHMHDMKIDPKQARFEYGEIAQAGKTLAKELDCAVVMLAQLNRALETRANKRPTMADLRESGEIEQKADVITLLHRDDYYDPKKNPGVVEAICAKGRGLKPRPPIHLQNRFGRMRLEDWAGPLPSARCEADEGFA